MGEVGFILKVLVLFLLIGIILKGIGPIFKLYCEIYKYVLVFVFKYWYVFIPLLLVIFTLRVIL